MALLSKAEVAEKTGIATKNISVYIQRGKLVMSGDFIDDTIQKNKDFIEKWVAKRQLSSGSGMTSIPDIPNFQQPEGEIPKEIRKGDIKPPSKNSYQELEIQKKTLEIEKLTEDITKVRLQNEKLQGENIPVDLVRDIFIRHTKNITAGFKTGVENLIIELQKSLNMTQEQMANFRGTLIGIINSSVENSVKESKNQLAAVVREYSVKKGVGEHG